MRPSSLDNSLCFKETESIDIQSFSKDMREAKLMQNFADSFLIDISNNHENSDYIKIWSNRSENMSIVTALDYKNGKVYKYPYDERSIKHIMKMDRSVCRYGKMVEHPYVWTGKRLEADILKYPSLSDIYSLADDKMKRFVLDEYQKILLDNSQNGSYYSKEFEEVFGTEKTSENLHWIENGNTDLSFDNIFVDGDRWVVIDAEWNLGIMVPVEFIIYRSFKCLGLDKVLIENLLGVSSSIFAVFDKWEHHLCYEYQGTKELCLHKRFVLDENKVDSLLEYDSFTNTTKKFARCFDSFIKAVLRKLGR